MPGSCCVRPSAGSSTLSSFVHSMSVVSLTVVTVRDPELWPGPDPGQRWELLYFEYCENFKLLLKNPCCFFHFKKTGRFKKIRRYGTGTVGSLRTRNVVLSSRVWIRNKWRNCGSPTLPEVRAPFRTADLYL
jgi:hypothetical protein